MIPVDAGGHAGHPAHAAPLKKLNGEYLAALVRSDVRWFEAHLADEFVCRMSDGAALDRAAFLARTAAGWGFVECQLNKVRVRPEAESATVEGTGTLIRQGGEKGVIRYVAWYRHIRSEWKLVLTDLRLIGP